MLDGSAKDIYWDEYYLERVDSEAFDPLVGESPIMKFYIRVEILACAETDDNVLILGETGTGKEIVANLIHSLSTRGKRDLVTVAVPSLQETLIESELFGYAKGSFTGASRDTPGVFQQADKSTIFLDEIGDMPKEWQSKLLRTVEQKEFYPMGSRKPVKSDFRVISATNQPTDRLRADLYYRLAEKTIEIPPLRERREDILSLIEHFLSQRQIEFRGLHMNWVSLYNLIMYEWPGNVRELRNLCKNCSISDWRGFRDLYFSESFPFKVVEFNHDRYDLPPPRSGPNSWGWDHVPLEEADKRLYQYAHSSDWPNLNDVFASLGHFIVSKPKYKEERQEYKKEKQQKAISQVHPQDAMAQDTKSSKGILPDGPPPKSQVDLAIEQILTSDLRLPELKENIIRKFLEIHPVTDRVGQKLNSRARQLGIDPKTLKKYLPDQVPSAAHPNTLELQTPTRIVKLKKR